MSQLRRLEEAVAIAILWGIMSVLRRIPPNVVIATPCLSVGIATLVSKRQYSDGFGRDLKKLKKFGEISDIWSKVSEPSVRISTKCTSAPGSYALVKISTSFYSYFAFIFCVSFFL